MDQGVDRPAAPARRQRHRHPRPDRAARSSRRSSTTATTCSPPSSASPPTTSPRPSRSPARPSATPPPTPPRPRPSPTLAGTSEAPGEFAGREKEIKEAVRSLTKKLVRKRIVEEGVRIDGRGLADLRPVSAEVGVLPTAHGSGLFQRGETQVLNVCTLAMPRMNQLLDTLNPETTEAVPPPLQHAAVGQRRDRPRRFAEAPRDRPRRARRPGRSCPSCRARRSSPTRCASCPR